MIEQVFQGDRYHVKTNLPQNNSPAKMKVLSGGQNRPQDDLDNDILLHAMNNSFLKRMSDAGDTTLDDILQMFGNFALNFLNVHPPDIAERKWCIVELDERLFTQDSFLSTLSCQGCSTDSSSDRPSSLGLYCLVLNMDNKQLHFQSLADPARRLFINIDTVPCELNEVNVHSPFYDELISLQVEKRLKVDIYITKQICSFPFSVNSKQQQQINYAKSSKVALEKLLKQAVNKSKGPLLTHPLVLQNENQFSQRRFATEQQFVNYCENGDILLFRDNHTFAKVQRAVTNSEYDHVGVVYKHERYGICLFQSNSGLGVALAMWNQLIRHKWFKNINRISWRKLQVHNKPKNFDAKFGEFVKENLHKKFGLSPGKLLKFKAVSHEEKKDYFCSELVGTLYRHLGLLDPEKAATQYWPKDFSDKGSLNILNGALDPERELVFEDTLLKKSYPLYK